MTKPITAAQKIRHEKIRGLGCIICKAFCQIHHTGTGMGGRRDHDKVIGLCYLHHQGAEGLHTLGRRAWQAKYGSEAYYLRKTSKLLGEINDTDIE